MHVWLPDEPIPALHHLRNAIHKVILNAMLSAILKVMI